MNEDDDLTPEQREKANALYHKNHCTQVHQKVNLLLRIDSKARIPQFRKDDSLEDRLRLMEFMVFRWDGSC